MTVLAALLEGASLRMTMWPDPAIVPEMPTHVEGFDLPHVIAVGDDFWAMTATCLSSGGPIPSSFAYPSRGRVFCSFMPSCGAGVLMSAARYTRRGWHLRDDCLSVWDSESGGSTQEIQSAVEGGRRLKIALLDAEEIWNLHPVHLPMVADGWFDLRTPVDAYPAWFREPGSIDEREGRLPPETIASPRFSAAPFPTWYSVCADGTYRGAMDAVPRPYRRLKVFAEQ